MNLEKVATVRFCLIATMIGLYIFATNFATSFFREFMSETSTSLVDASMIFVIGIFLLWILKSKLINDFNLIKQKTYKLWLIPLFIVLSLVFQVIIQNVITVTSNNQNGLEKSIQNSGSIGILILFVLIILAGPFIEEIIFQYFFQKLILENGLLKIKVPHQVVILISVVGATLLFMMFHVQSLNDIYNLSFFEYSDLILFAVLYEISDENLIYPIILHVLLNSIAFVSAI